MQARTCVVVFCGGLPSDTVATRPDTPVWRNQGGGGGKGFALIILSRYTCGGPCKYVPLRREGFDIWSTTEL